MLNERSQSQRTTFGIPHSIVFHFIVLQLHRVFYKLKVCGYPVSSKSIGAIVPTAFARSVCLFWYFSQYFKLFHCYICYGDLWSAMFDVIIATVLGCHEYTYVKWQASLINVHVLTAPLTGCSPVSHPLLGSSYETQTILKLGQLITLQWPLAVQVKARVTCRSL